MAVPHRSALKDLRKLLFQRADWEAEPTSSAVELANSAINSALSRMVLEHPGSFFESRIRMYTQADAKPSLAGDTLSLALEVDGLQYNPYVMRVDLETGTTGAVQWQTDRSWDGRLIDIQDAAGIKRTMRIRSVWSEDDEDPSRYYFSLWHPWNRDRWGVGPFTKWRVYTREYYFPDDMIAIKSMRLLGSDSTRPLEVISQDEAEEDGLDEHPGTNVGGAPERLYRREHFSLAGPNTAPSVSLGNTQIAGQRWTGPDPFGKFRYVITYSMGNREYVMRNPGGINFLTDDGGDGFNTSIASAYPYAKTLRRQESLWESSPSPESAEITTTKPDASSHAPAILVELPNVEHLLGFLADGLSTGSVAFARRHSGHSGWYVRIYRRRLTEDFAFYSSLGVTSAGIQLTGLSKLDIHDDYYLLAEMRVEPGNARFVDDGSAIPDFQRPLRSIHGYEAMRFDPPPDARYEIECRYLKRPPRLVSPSDVPAIHENSIPALIELALHYFRQSQHEYGQAAAAEMAYERQLKLLRMAAGDLRPQTTVVVRDPARVR